MDRSMYVFVALLMIVVQLATACLTAAGFLYFGVHGLWMLLTMPIYALQGIAFGTYHRDLRAKVEIQEYLKEKIQ